MLIQVEAEYADHRCWDVCMQFLIVICLVVYYWVTTTSLQFYTPLGKPGEGQTEIPKERETNEFKYHMMPVGKAVSNRVVPLTYDGCLTIKAPSESILEFNNIPFTTNCNEVDKTNAVWLKVNKTYVHVGLATGPFSDRSVMTLEAVHAFGLACSFVKFKFNPLEKAIFNDGIIGVIPNVPIEGLGDSKWTVSFYVVDNTTFMRYRNKLPKDISMRYNVSLGYGALVKNQWQQTFGKSKNVLAYQSVYNINPDELITCSLFFKTYCKNKGSGESTVNVYLWGRPDTLVTKEFIVRNKVCYEVLGHVSAPRAPEFLKLVVNDTIICGSVKGQVIGSSEGVPKGADIILGTEFLRTNDCRLDFARRLLVLKDEAISIRLLVNEKVDAIANKQVFRNDRLGQKVTPQTNISQIKPKTKTRTPKPRKETPKQVPKTPKSTPEPKTTKHKPESKIPKSTPEPKTMKSNPKTTPNRPRSARYTEPGDQKGKEINFEDLGDASFQNKNYESARKYYTMLIRVMNEENPKISPGMYLRRESYLASIHLKRSAARNRLGNIDGAIRDVDIALALRHGKCSTSYDFRGRYHYEKKEYGSAAKDFRKAVNLKPCLEFYQRLQNALAMSGSLFESYYDVVEVPENATDSEIQRAYKQRALKVHPDKVGLGSEEETEMFKNLFADLCNAKCKLLDKRERRIHDRKLAHLEKRRRHTETIDVDELWMEVRDMWDVIYEQFLRKYFIFRIWEVIRD